MRYIITLSALSTGVFLRVQIGSNIYAPFTTKPFGKGEAGYYAASPGTRFITIILLYLWMRVFFIVCFVNNPLYFNANSWSSWRQLIEGFYTLSFFETTAYPPECGFFFALSYLAVMVPLLQLIVSYEILPRQSRPKQTSLGYSLLFGWTGKFNKDKAGLYDHYFILGVIEPLLAGTTGLIFFILHFPVHAWFFWISGTGLFVQGQLKRIRSRREKDLFEVSIDDRNETLELQEQVLNTKRQDDVKKQPPPDEIAIHVP